MTGPIMTWSIVELTAEITAVWLIFLFAFGLPLVPAFIAATIVRLFFVALEIVVFAALYVLLSLFLYFYEWFFEREHTNPL